MGPESKALFRPRSGLLLACNSTVKAYMNRRPSVSMPRSVEWVHGRQWSVNDKCWHANPQWHQVWVTAFEKNSGS